jgi:chromosome segregation protein
VKLEFVEMEGFRGFRHRARFDIPSGFLVIVGRNGVGKSTILDAIDFALTGTINKYDIARARGGGLSEHIWWVGERRAKSHFVSVGFVDGSGSHFVVTRYRGKPEAEGLVDVLRSMQDERIVGRSADGLGLMETTLIRDEVISASSLDLPGHQRFNTVKAAIGAIMGPDYSERTGKILDEARAALADEQDRLTTQQAELGRLLAQLTDARTEAAQSSDIAEALRLVAEAVPHDEVRTSAEEVRRMVADRRAALANFTRARAMSAEMSEERTRVRSDAFGHKMAAIDDELRQANLLLAAHQQTADLARRLVETEEQSDLEGSHFAALLEHGSVLGLQEGHCPLCGAMRTDKEFEAALEAIRTKLAGQAGRTPRQR